MCNRVQTQGVVIGLIPAILAIVQDGHAVAAAAVGQVGPILGIDFVGGRRIVAALHTADTQVVEGLLIGHTQGKFGFKQGTRLAPVHFIVEVDAACKNTFIETDILAESRLSVLLLHAKGLAQGTVLYQRGAHVSADGYGSSIDGFLQYLPGRPSV